MKHASTTEYDNYPKTVLSASWIFVIRMRLSAPRDPQYLDLQTDTVAATSHKRVGACLAGDSKGRFYRYCEHFKQYLLPRIPMYPSTPLVSQRRNGLRGQLLLAGSVQRQ